MNLTKPLYNRLDRLDHGDRVLASLFASGAAGGAILAILKVLSYKLDWPFVVVYALLGAAILPVAELASRLASSWWAKGLLFGMTAGVLVGLCDHALFAEGPLPMDLLASVAGGVAGGLVWKFGAPFEKTRQNGTAVRRREYTR